MGFLAETWVPAAMDTPVEAGVVRYGCGGMTTTPAKPELPNRIPLARRSPDQEALTISARPLMMVGPAKSTRAGSSD